MFNLKFGAFAFTFSLLLTSCVCESNETTSCKIQEKTATCESNVDFKNIDTNITKLIVRSKELHQINKDDLALFVDLEEIDLSNCGLESIDENALIDLSKLHKINLAGNKKLKILSDQRFFNSDTVTSLNLSNTGVEELGIVVEHLPQLQELDLNGTNIRDFSPLEHLEHLAKLVVSKTNETFELCNISTIKEIIVKDENGTATILDCKTIKENAETEVENKTETASIVPTINKEDEIKKAPIITPVVTAEIAPEITPENATKNASNVPQNLEETKVVNETIKTPTLLHESSENEATTVTVVVEEKHEQPNKTRGDETKPEESSKKEDKIKPKEDEIKPKEDEIKPKEDEIAPKQDEIKPDENAKTDEIKPEETAKNQPEAKPEENENTAEVKPETKSNIKLEENKIAPRFGAVDKDSSEKPQVLLDSSDDVILPSTENKSQSNGVNIVLGIILCVMVVGAVGFGFKYWKNRRSGYTHANTHDHEDEDKELQTIVAHRTDPEQN